MSNFRQLRGIKTVLVALLLGGLSAFGQSAPSGSNSDAPISNNGQPVNDYANVIDDAVEQQINQKIKDFMKRTNPPVVLAVATVRTTGDREIFDYSLAVARGWKIGSKTEDNPSALLFVAVDDRKYQTQVSRDLEDELPDGLAGQLQRQYLVPAFKQGNYTKGISDTIDAYIRTIEARQSGAPAGQTQPSPTPSTRKSSSPFSTAGICCLVVIILLLVLIFSRRGGRGGGNRWGGGGGGSALPWIVGSIIANSASHSGGSSSWGGGSGSGWDSGGSSGGGDWGGFGGGGDFGGGGAGGDW